MKCSELVIVGLIGVWAQFGVGIAHASSDGGLDAGLEVRLDGGASDASDSAGGALDGGRVWASCVEYVPEGATRPKLTNVFPSRGFAGHALTLKVQLEHGLGETVLPNGFRIQSDSDAARAISSAGFVLPDPKGSAAPKLTRRDEADKSITELEVHFLSLPSEPGRHQLTLPPIPVAVSRASGEYLTICTTPHVIVIDEPIVDEARALPRGNPTPRSQTEVWTLARDLTYGGIIGGIIALLVATAVVWWRRRPKRLPPPPPPRPAWEVAFEALEKLRHSHLVSDSQRAEHMDRVSDVVRVYLGDRYGFDGIESTTQEVLAALQGLSLPVGVFGLVSGLLQHSDLVKFARWMPSVDDCARVLEDAERIVRDTMHAVDVPVDNAPPAETGAGGSADSESATLGSVDLRTQDMRVKEGGE